MTTSFFFVINGYTFTITSDAPEFAVETARRCEAPKGHSIPDEIERISKWLVSRVSYSGLTLAAYRKVRNSLPSQATTDELLVAQGWNTYYRIWRLQTTQRFAELIGKKPTGMGDLLRDLFKG